ncbi:magnesium transporter MgtE N-terminal domain-containing protein [Thermodesulfobacteriota bacterium]
MKKMISGFNAGIWVLIILAAVCLSLISAPAFSADKSVATLTEFSGKVMIKSQGSWGVKPKKGLLLYSEDKVVTRIGLATITFNDGAVMEIKANSNLLIKESEEENKGVGERIKVVKRSLRLLLGKMFFRTGRGSKTKTSLETATMVCGLRGTAGTLSIGAGGQTFIQFTSGEGDTVGNFISGIAEDVPSELANLNPAQRAAFVAAAAAAQAAQAAELAAGDADMALAGAQAAEAAAQEAKAAAEAMLNNPVLAAEAAAAIAAADEAILAAQAAKQQAIDEGAKQGAPPETYVPPEVEGGEPGAGFVVDPKKVEEKVIERIEIPPEVGGELTELESAKADLLAALQALEDAIAAGLDPTDALAALSAALDKFNQLLTALDPAAAAAIIAAMDPAAQAAVFAAMDPAAQAAIIEAMAAAEAMATIPPAEAAAIIAAMDPAAQAAMFAAMDPAAQAAVFAAMDPAAQAVVFAAMAPEAQAALIAAMAPEAQAAIFAAMDPAEAAAIISMAPAGTFADIPLPPGLEAELAPPVITITSQPELITNSATNGFQVEADKEVTFFYSIDGSGLNPAAAGGSFDLGELTEELHTVVVTAIDNYGNVSTVSYSWTTDYTAPNIFLKAEANTDGTATVTAYSTNYEPGGTGTVDYVFDGANTGLGSGEHTLTVTATDQAGNPLSQPFTFTLDIGTPIVGQGGSDITGTATTIVATVEGENWGGWFTSMGGDWTGTNLGSLDMASGGGDILNGFQLQTVSGSLDPDNVTATNVPSEFTSLTPFNLTSGTGTFSGTFNPDGSWTGTETGSGLVDTPFAFSGEWGVDFVLPPPDNTSLYYNDLGVHSIAAHETGLFGLTSLAGDNNFHALGEFTYDPDYTPQTDERFVWSSAIATLNEGPSFISGNGIVGFTSGIWQNYSMYGSVAALSLETADPVNGPFTIQGLLGNVAGDYYHGIGPLGADGMWGVDGTLSIKTQPLTITNPEVSPYMAMLGNPEPVRFTGKFLDDALNPIDSSSIEGFGYGLLLSLSDDSLENSLGVYTLGLGYDFGNSYSGKPTPVDGQDIPIDVSWQAFVGGPISEGPFDGPSRGGGGAWFASVNGTWSPTGEITGYLGEVPGDLSTAAFGKIVTPYGMGDIGGPLHGINVPEGEGAYWIGDSVGLFEGSPVAFFGYWEDDMNRAPGFLLYDDMGIIDFSYGYGYGGIQYGNIGLALNGSNYDFLAIGGFEGGYGGGTLLWNSPVNAYDTTDTGGYLGGYTGGFWRGPGEAINGTMEGFAAAVYTSPADSEGYTAGLMTGNLSGEYYPGINMWMADGTMTPSTTALVTGLNPYDLYPEFGSMSIEAGLSGRFNSDGPTGGIDGWQGYYTFTNWGFTNYIYDSGTGSSLPFGVYDFKLGEENEYYGKPMGEDDVQWWAVTGGQGRFDDSGNGSWLASIKGDWTPDGEINGYLGGIPDDEATFGRYLTPYQMGDIGGPFFGLYTGYPDGYGGYYDYGTWVGESVGTYEGKPLDFSAEWKHSLLYDDYGEIYWASGDGETTPWDIPYPEGMLGLTRRTAGDGTKLFDLLAIGTYTDLGYGGGGYGGPYLMSGSIQGEEIINGGYGGIYGFNGGLWKKENPEDTYGDIEGNTVAVYTADGKVGLAYGQSAEDIAGEFFETFYGYGYYSGAGYGGGLWKMEGTLINKEMDPPPGFDPMQAWFTDSSMGARLAGGFDGGTGDTIFGDYYNGKTKYIYYYDFIHSTNRSLPFGVYNLKLGEGYDYNYYWNKPIDVDVSWNAKVGGSGQFGYNDDDNGYWLADIGSTWFAEEVRENNYYGIIDGDLTGGTYLTGTHKGVIGGPFYGLYTQEDTYNIGEDTFGEGTWIGLSVGTYEGESLDFGGYWGATTLWTWSGGFGPTGSDPGRIGLMALGGDYDLLAMGEFYDYGGPSGYGGPYVWNSDIQGGQVIDGVQAGYGGFEGYTGGGWNKADPDGNSGDMNGYAAAIYGKEDSAGDSAGLLFGGANGYFYDLNEGGYGGMWKATGTLKSVEMASLDPDTISIGYGGLYFYDYGGYGGFGADGSSGGIYVYSREGQIKFIEGQDWGVWKSMVGGGYGGAPLDTWYLPLESSYDGINSWIEVVGNKWSNGKVAADVAGAWVNVTDAVTGVMGGGLKGTYNPSLATWQAMGIGTFIGTNNFLTMVDTGQVEVLQGLNIPAIEVGSANLRGTGGYEGALTVNMWDTRFFKYSTGGARIFASGEVTGNDGARGTLHALPGNPVNLTGSNYQNAAAGLSAQFQMNTWNTGTAKWSGTVSNGGGTVGGSPVSFKGGAAGDIAGGTDREINPYTFKGTAAGVVQPPAPAP